ncbi:MAG: nucleotidyltransferase [Bdellovibrionota bacterium]
MSLIQGITEFTSQLKIESVQFGIIGGLAVFAYGGERTTFDVDFLIHADNRLKVKEIAQKLHLKIVNENSEVIQFSGSVQIDIIFANRPVAQGMLNRLRQVGELPYPVVAPEDIIGLKIQAFVGDRSREFTDKGDILTILKNVPNLDLNKVKEYADIFNVWNEIKEIKNRS